MYLGKVFKASEREWPLSAMETAPEDTTATITIRLLKPGERQDIFFSGLKTIYTPDESGSLHPEMRAEQNESTKALFFKSVVGWSKIFEDAEGNKPLKFGHAGKVLLLSMVPEIAQFVAECHGKMVEEAEGKKEESEKNSLSTSGDKTKSQSAGRAKG